MIKIFSVVVCFLALSYAVSLRAEDISGDKRIVQVRIAVGDNGEMRYFVNSFSVSELHKKNVWTYHAGTEVNGRKYEFIVRPMSEKDFFFMGWQSNEGGRPFANVFSGVYSTDRIKLKNLDEMVHNGTTRKITGFASHASPFFYFTVNVFSHKEELRLLRNVIEEYDGVDIEGKEEMCDRSKVIICSY